MNAAQEEMERAVREAFAGEAGELLRQVERALHGLVGGEPAEREARCIDMLRGLHTLKGSAAVAGQEQVKQLAHALEERMRGVLSDTAPLAGAALDEVFAEVERLYEAVDVAVGASESRAAPAPAPVSAPSAPPQAPAPVPERAAPEELLRVRPSRLEALDTLMGELTLCVLQQEALAGQLREARERLGEAAEHWKELSARVEALRRVLPPERWASLKAARDACGPALEGAVRLVGGAVRELPPLLSHAATVGAGLEQGLRELRMMPLRPFFEEFARVARETARAAGKEVRLVIDAEGAEVDRVVVLRLKDALLHLVRNAVVHGLEAPELRRARGKPEVGTLTLEARCEGARAVLRVADDGAGIDVARVRGRARQLGLFSGPDRELEADELLSVLTRPGFSTRDEADMLAGRGIGLDVVQSTLHDLDGQLRLEHTPGRGTAFLLDVPITASTSRGLVVEVQGERFGLPLHSIERLLRVGVEDLGQVQGLATVRVGSEAISVVPLAELLGASGRGVPPRRRPAVVLRQGRQRLALLVDDVVEEQTLVIKPLPPAFAGAQLVLGGALQPDGAVLPVLQASALFARAAGGLPEANARRVLAPAQPEVKLSVLVVDDSITMRTLLRNVLQAAGYDVTVAFDGHSAVELFLRQPADLVVTDLQMPRLDGVGVCRSIRGSSRPRTPIILVTSVGAPEGHQRALEAGADAYVVKGEFEQAAFLEMVRTLTGEERTLE